MATGRLHDTVGYSQLSVNEQHAQVDELNEIVRLSEQFRKAEAASRLLKVPTGDGMALVFYRSPEEPAQCAVEISRALKDNARVQVRMGIHSGPVSGVVDDARNDAHLWAPDLRSRSRRCVRHSKRDCKGD